MQGNPRYENMKEALRQLNTGGKPFPMADTDFQYWGFILRNLPKLTPDQVNGLTVASFPDSVLYYNFVWELVIVYGKAAHLFIEAETDRYAVGYKDNENNQDDDDLPLPDYDPDYNYWEDEGDDDE